MVLKTIDELILKVSTNNTKKRMAVPGAADAHTLEAVKMAADEGIVKPILIGEKESVLKIIEEIGGMKEFEIVDIADADEAAQKAVDLINHGEADFILKGKINSSNLLRPVVDKKGLNIGNVISHLTIAQVPGYHKLVALTDCAMNIQPNLEQKVSIVKNAINAFNQMGYEKPKVALLCANEEVNSKQNDTVEARYIQDICANNDLGMCEVCGPITFDIAMDSDAAKIKGFENPVAGDADILVVPNLVTGNVLNKALKQFGHSVACGTVIGAKCPIGLTSRSASVFNKFLSIVFSASMV